MISAFAQSHANVLGFRMSGRLHADDYRQFVPAVDAAIAAHGRVRILVLFEAFEGWDLAAMWNDFKFTTSHYRAVERFAIVGERQKEAWVAQLGRFFTGAEVRYFEAAELAAAWAWLDEGQVTAPVAPLAPDAPLVTP